MDPETAIRRLSFAEARDTGAEALAAMVQHRREMLDAAAEQRVEVETTEMADRARDEQRQHHVVDKTA
jgi:hypothetical protein